VSCRHTKYLTHSFIAPGPVFDVALNVIAIAEGPLIGYLESTIYEAWAWEYGSSLRHDLRYTLKDCFNTFPFPIGGDAAAITGEEFHKLRVKLMRSSIIGMTKLYNQFHDPDNNSDDISELRQKRLQNDETTLTAYGWEDLNLGYDFYIGKLGTRYTISESARREVLQRLLKLNHERYEEEVKQGLHAKKKGARRKSAPRKRAAKKAPKKQKATLFDMEGES